MKKNEIMARLTAAIGGSEAGDAVLKEVFADGETFSKEDLEKKLKALNALSEQYQKDGDETMLDLTNQKIEVVQKAIDLL